MRVGERFLNKEEEKKEAVYIKHFIWLLGSITIVIYWFVRSKVPEAPPNAV
jgi:hypothetical protein